ncbi:MAG: rhomboid family intramembrane serine protease [Bacteroidota bacterium]
MTNAYRPPSAVPPVIKNLLILNGLVFLAQQIPPLSFYLNTYASLWPLGTPSVVDVVPYGPIDNVGFYPWQVVTSAFLHADVWHILFNMYGLWLFGNSVEREIGSKRFATLYGASVLGASALQLAVATGTLASGGGLITTIGASGGLLGVVMAAAILFPRAELFIIPFPVPIQLRWLAIGYIALDVLGGFGLTQSNVAHFAHLGGAATGALLLQYWRGRLPLRPRTA